jgi:hypothetical protein
MDCDSMNRFFGSLIIAFAACSALAFAPLPEAVKAIIGLAGAAALLLALWELAKTNQAAQNPSAIPPERAENAFVLSATGYMAEKAFDKHVEFCEAYLAKANEVLCFLFELGPSEKVSRRVPELCQIRRQFALWETENVAIFLSKFEAALRQAGEDRNSSRHLPAAAERKDLVTSICGTFGQMIPLGDFPEELAESASPEMAIIRITSTLQEQLGFAHLAQLREHYLSEAVRCLE